MPPIEFVRDQVTLDHVRALAEATFGDLVKAVIDVERGIMAIGGELHADEEAALLDAAGASVSTILHVGLVGGRWHSMPLMDQLANIGSEVARAMRARSRNDEERTRAALDRALELFDLTLSDDRWKGRRREIARAREVVVDFLAGDNAYGSTPQSVDAYFLAFAVAARRGR